MRKPLIAKMSGFLMFGISTAHPAPVLHPASPLPALFNESSMNVERLLKPF